MNAPHGHPHLHTNPQSYPPSDSDSGTNPSFPSIRAAWSKSFAPIHRLATATHPSTQRPRLPDALVFRRAPRPTELHLLEARVAGWAGVVGHQCIMGLCGF